MTKNPNIQYRDSKQIPISKFSKPKACFEYLRFGSSGLSRASRFGFQVLFLGLFLALFIFSFVGAAGAAQKINVHQPKIDEKKKTITISWDAVDRIETYKVFKSDGTLYPGGDVKKATSYTLKNAEPNTTYIFKIRGYKAGSTNSAGDAQRDISFTTPSASGDGSEGTSSTGTPVTIGAPFPGEQSSTTLPEHVYRVYKWAAGIGSLLATLMIIFAGFKYATSSGNPDALQDAKDTIIGSLIGLSIIILSYLLLKTIGVKL